MTIKAINSEDFDIELKKLLERIDEIRPDADLYSVLVDEQVLVAQV